MPIIKKSPTKLSFPSPCNSPVGSPNKLEEFDRQQTGDGVQSKLAATKLFKYIDPKTEKFTNQLKNDTKKHSDKARDRLDRTRQYDAMINVTHLKVREGIDALPYIKEDYRDMLVKHSEKKLVKKEIKTKINTNRIHIDPNDKSASELEIDTPIEAPVSPTKI